MMQQGGRQTEMRRHLAAARQAGDLAAAEGVARAALANRPSDRYWRTTLARVLLRSGRAGQARRLADTVLAADPAYVPALVARGEALLALGHRAAAAAALETAWQRRPDPHVAHALAKAYAARNLERAAILLREAVTRFPRDGGLQLRLGVLLERLGRTDEAAGAYRAAMVEERTVPVPAGREPGFAYARLLRVRLRVRAAAEALAEIERVMLVPSLVSNPHLLALYAECLERAGRVEEAAVAFGAAAARAPADLGLAARWAFALRRAGRWRDARPVLERIIAAGACGAAVLAAYVADARAHGLVPVSRRFLRSVVLVDPQRRHLWGWLRRLGAAPALPAGRMDAAAAHPGGGAPTERRKGAGPPGAARSPEGPKPSQGHIGINRGDDRPAKSERQPGEPAGQRDAGDQETPGGSGALG